MFSRASDAPPPRTIALLTDFGVADPYVGQMKGVFARKAPGVPVVDISHDVAPYNVAQAAFFLAASYAHFPKDTVFLSVVDPGVGTSRKIVCLELGDRLFVAPDNGLLSLALKLAWAVEVRVFDVSVALDAPKNVAQTFHGRDVFAPLTAWLSLGGKPEELGREMGADELVCQDWSQPIVTEGSVQAHVLHIDRFGNCVLNVEAGSMGTPSSVRMTAPSGGELAYVTTYGDMPEGGPGLLEGSQGFLEIAVNQRSAAKRFGLSMGDSLTFEWEGECGI